MKYNNRLYAYVIGEDNFTMACVELLLNYQFIVKAICTCNPHLVRWANKNNISVYHSYEAFEQKIQKAKHGFLFSILNSKIIPYEILNKKNFYCINYHNALLPYYGGPHATSWAIINREIQHGVTWHKMSKQVDGGDIIKQSTIEVDKFETAISLNLKCTEHGLRLFNELITEFLHEGWKTQKQDLSLRTYFPKSMKPGGNSLISWKNAAEDIERLSRACNYAHILNDFSLPKINLNEGHSFVSVKKFSLSSKVSSGKPGEIMHLSDQGLEISTITNNIVANGFVDSYGKELSIEELQKMFSLQVGACLPLCDIELLKFFRLTSENCSKYEKRWVGNFIEAKIPSVPKVSINKSRRVARYKKIAHYSIGPVTKNFQNLTSTYQSYINLAFIIIYLQRINNYEQFDIGITSKDVLVSSEIQHLFFNFNWLRCSFSLEQNFENFLKEIDAELNKENYKSNCLRDVIARYPSLKNHYAFPSIIIAVDDVDLKYIEASFLIRIEQDHVSLYLNKAEEKLEDDQYYLVESMGQRIQIMFHGLNNNVNIPLYKLPFLNGADLNLYFETFSHSKDVALPKKNLIELFENQVIKNPSQKAVVYKDLALSYFELNNQANNLARFLLENQVNPGEYIGITSLSGIETIIFLIAVLKVGAIYVPIDPIYPDKYLGYILTDLNPKLILSRTFSSYGFEVFLSRYYPHIHFYSFSYNKDAPLVDNLNLKHNNKAAYVMYTSGSTGKPKGVVAPEAGIIRLVINNNFLSFKAKYKIAQASNLSFDASTLEIWGALLNGATLICMDKETILDPIKLKNALIEKHIDILWLTSSLFDQHVENYPMIFNTVKYLLVGGDVVNATTVKKVLQANEGGIEFIINGYGPTENTTFSTTYVMKAGDKIGENIPIGRPIAHTQAYVVDKYLQLVFIGVPGELLLSGVGLATHYVSYGAKDKEFFVETSIINGKIQRYYKTGDYVKWLSDGNLAYLGRKDNQTKLRGFRIELNTIKNVILQYEKISQCHLTTTNNQLCAYIIIKNKRVLSKAEILNYLSENLPYYMVPSEIIFLDYFPLNVNGKIDSAAIQALDISLNKRQVTNPTTKTEQLLLEIWQSILNQEIISTDDNFFEIGGNSLIISALISRIYQEFSYRLALSEFLSEPTITLLADLIEGNQKKTKITANLLADVNFNLPSGVDYPLRNVNLSSRSILVTGANGFLGAHLVYELAKINKNVVCFVRETSHDRACLKLKESFNRWNLPEYLLGKITIAAGDLSSPKLGLRDEDYEKLVVELDEIYHAAADVNHIYGYDQLRISNVVATENVLALASLNKKIQINYISTLSACFNHVDKQDRILETFIEEKNIPENVNDGYSLTKWVGERLIERMHKGNFKVKIFRPAWITGDTQYGCMPLGTNHLFLLLKACVQLGYAPDWNARINMTPVDELAKAIVIGTTHDAKVFNVVSDQPVLWIDYINSAKKFGYRIKIIEAQKWYALLGKIDETNALFPLLSIYTDDHSHDWILKQDIISNAHNNNYHQLIDQVNQTSINQDLLAKYLTQAGQFLYSVDV